MINSLEKFLSTVQKTQVKFDLQYNISGKCLGEYTIKTIFPETLLITPVCEVQRDLYIPNPLRTATTLEIRDKLQITICEDDATSVYTLSFSLLDYRAIAFEESL